MASHGVSGRSPAACPCLSVATRAHSIQSRFKNYIGRNQSTNLATVRVSVREARWQEGAGTGRTLGPGLHRSGVGVRQPGRHLRKERGPYWYHTKDGGPAGSGFCQHPRWQRREVIM
ncbi:unnamed protein product [Coccothraustes coccothraustes]